MPTLAQLAIFLMSIACFYRGTLLSYDYLMVCGRSLLTVSLGLYSHNNNPISQIIRNLNTTYLTSILSVFVVRYLLNTINQTWFDPYLIVRIIAWIVSASSNSNFVQHRSLVFGKKIGPQESIIVISLLVLGRFLKQYRFFDTMSSYAIALAACWLTTALLHLLRIRDFSALSKWPYYTIIAILFMCAFIRGMGSHLLKEYSNNQIQMELIRSNKALLPSRFPPEKGPQFRGSTIDK